MQYNWPEGRDPGAGSHRQEVEGRWPEPAERDRISFGEKDVRVKDCTAVDFVRSLFA